MVDEGTNALIPVTASELKYARQRSVEESASDTVDHLVNIILKTFSYQHDVALQGPHLITEKLLRFCHRRKSLSKNFSYILNYFQIQLIHNLLHAQ